MAGSLLVAAGPSRLARKQRATRLGLPVSDPVKEFLSFSF